MGSSQTFLEVLQPCEDARHSFWRVLSNNQFARKQPRGTRAPFNPIVFIPSRREGAFDVLSLSLPFNPINPSSS